MTLGAVQRFIRMLPAEQQTALVLVCVEGLSYKEAVHVLDLPMGALTSWLGCARIALNAFANGPPPEPAEGGG